MSAENLTAIQAIERLADRMAPKGECPPEDLRPAGYPDCLKDADCRLCWINTVKDFLGLDDESDPEVPDWVMSHGCRGHDFHREFGKDRGLVRIEDVVKLKHSYTFAYGHSGWAHIRRWESGLLCNQHNLKIQGTTDGPVPFTRICSRCLRRANTIRLAQRG